MDKKHKVRIILGNVGIIVTVLVAILMFLSTLVHIDSLEADLLCLPA